MLKLTIKIFMHSLLQYCASGKIKKNEMGWACGAYEGGEKYEQGFGREA
jgi:hypothetical protein